MEMEECWQWKWKSAGSGNGVLLKWKVVDSCMTLNDHARSLIFRLLEVLDLAVFFPVNYRTLSIADTHTILKVPTVLTFTSTLKQPLIRRHSTTLYNKQFSHSQLNANNT